MTLFLSGGRRELRAAAIALHGNGDRDEVNGTGRWSGLDEHRRGQLIDVVGNIRVEDAEARSRDVLGRPHENFLSQGASADGERLASFILRAGSSGCSSRRWSPTAGGSTIPAVARRAGSSFSSSSFVPPPPATKHMATYQSTARSGTT